MDFTCGEGVSAANPRERRNTQHSYTPNKEMREGKVIDNQEGGKLEGD
ncbi:hypothetical protein [Gardnerella vaginalis]